MTFTLLSLLRFWNIIKDEYTKVTDKALRTIILFATSYLREAGFSAVTVLKFKYWPKLNVEKETGVAVSTLLSNFEVLINGKKELC